MSLQIYANTSTVNTAVSNMIGGGLEGYTFMGEETRKGEECVATYRWLYKKSRVWYSFFAVECIEIKLLAIVVCPEKGRTIRSAVFEKCSFGSISPNQITRSDIDGAFSRLLGVTLPPPLQL